MPHEVEVRTDNRLTTAGNASLTPADGRALHAWTGADKSVDDPLTVAVMDSGVHEDLFDTHPWFETATLGKQYDPTGTGAGGDQVGHGSGVASIYGKNTPAVEIYDVRIFGDSGQGGFGPIADAYKWLIDHADEIDIVNMSWGAREDVSAINRLHEMLVSAGVHDVVAAGNTGGEGGSPATAKQAFSAGAVDENGDLTRFTSRDPNQDNPDVAAAGKDVKMARAPGTSMGTPLDDQFVKASGTSFAAPWTGAAYVNALYERRQSWDRAFEKAAPDIPGSKADGDGLLKLAPAIEGRAPEAPNPTTDASVWDFLGNDTVWIDADWLPENVSVAERLSEGKDHVDIRFR